MKATHQEKHRHREREVGSLVLAPRRVVLGVRCPEKEGGVCGNILVDAYLVGARVVHVVLSGVDRVAGNWTEQGQNCVANLGPGNHTGTRGGPGLEERVLAPSKGVRAGTEVDTWCKGNPKGNPMTCSGVVIC